MKWAVCDKLADYLKGHQFTVYTDNNPLTYILTSAKLDATTQRWVAALSSYDFDIIYRAGVSNADADGMSRHPSLHEEPDIKTITPEVLRAICSRQQAHVESLSVSSDVLDTIPDRFEDVELERIVEQQRADPDLSW